MQKMNASYSATGDKRAFAQGAPSLWDSCVAATSIGRARPLVDPAVVVEKTARLLLARPGDQGVHAFGMAGLAAMINMLGYERAQGQSGAASALATGRRRAPAADRNRTLAYRRWAGPHGRDA